MSKAFLDTTIIVDILLNKGSAGRQARLALSRYTSAEIPMYAIKEMKSGALRNWAWLHNKLSLTKSLGKTLQFFNSISRYRPNAAATATSAISQYLVTGTATFEMLLDRYGADAKPDIALADRLRYSARARVLTAWRERASLGSIVDGLSCYTESSPYIDKNGMLECKPITCTGQCCLGPRLFPRLDELEALRDVVRRQPPKRENSRRSKALKQVINGRQIGEKECRGLGDVVFALFAPVDSTILTTNIKDHAPLAQALGKRVDSP